MLQEFVDLITSALPAIEPNKAEVAKRAIREFLLGNSINLATTPNAIDIIQGDVIGPLKFYSINEQGELSERESLALVLTNTCDIENDGQIILCPCYSEQDFFRIFPHINTSELKLNRFGSFFYIYRTANESFISDFSEFGNYSTDLIRKLLNDVSIKRYVTLTQIGWYFLIAKLTYHFMRPEDSATHFGRTRN